MTYWRSTRRSVVCVPLKGRKRTARKKTEIRQEVTREVEHLLPLIFRGRGNQDGLDLDVVGTAIRRVDRHPAREPAHSHPGVVGMPEMI
jgi:hypothetical protein